MQMDEIAVYSSNTDLVQLNSKKKILNKFIFFQSLTDFVDNFDHNFADYYKYIHNLAYNHLL
jgi:hypothetical protein